MTTFGKNMKLTAPRSQRAALHTVMTEILGCPSDTPMDDFVTYDFSDGFCIGVYFVDDALDGEDYLLAPWLELRVDDVDAKNAALAEAGVEVVAYPRDPEHSYHRLPGGPVFRLAKRVESGH